MSADDVLRCGHSGDPVHIITSSVVSFMHYRAFKVGRPICAGWMYWKLLETSLALKTRQKIAHAKAQNWRPNGLLCSQRCISEPILDSYLDKCAYESY